LCTTFCWGYEAERKTPMILEAMQTLIRLLASAWKSWKSKFKRTERKAAAMVNLSSEMSSFA